MPPLIIMTRHCCQLSLNHYKVMVTDLCNIISEIAAIS